MAMWFIGKGQAWSRERTNAVMESALPPAATVILVTGAGGVFAKVLTASGIGAALSQSLIDTHLPLILMAFVISLALRAAQGSATVAILTTCGLLAEAINTGGYTTVQVALLCVAIGFGSLGLSHVNDSGFWIVTRYLGLSVGDGLRTWTVLTTVLGLTGFLLTCALWAFMA
jgi:GntP family gluconate:H+ symporter